jgi:Flp pilus assembly protein TadG
MKLPSDRKFARDERGSTIVEFAMIAPVMGLLLLGAFDTAHSLYMRSVLQGIVQKVARDASLESGTTATQQTVLDNKVRASVKAIANNANITITRRYYRTFSTASAAQAEAWTDTNHNDTCDAGEPYQDANNNSNWDADGGNNGQGGAKDKAVYSVSMSYPSYFPLYRIIGGSNTTVVSAETVLANQPYGDQGTYGTPTVRNCP